MKIYRIDLMGQEKPTYCTQEDVARIVEATNRGIKLVLIRQSLINPSSISRISRSYGADESVLDPIDEDLQIGISKVKQIQKTS